MSSRDAYAAVMELRYRDTDEHLALISEQLVRIAKAMPENQWEDSRFLEMLSAAIRPNEYGPFGVKLVVKRQGLNGAPAKKPDYAIGKFLWEQVDVLDVDTESALKSACDKFGIKRSKAAEELARMRAEVGANPAEYEDWATEIRKL